MSKKTFPSLCETTKRPQPPLTIISYDPRDPLNVCSAMADLDIEVSLFTNRLPREIRDEIYWYLFLAKNVKCYAEHVNRVSYAIPGIEVC